MKKNRRTGNPYWIRLPQKLIAMGLRVFLLVCVINTVSAAGFSQGSKLDVNFTNSTIGAVLDYLKEKAGYDFVYRKGVVRVDDVVTLKLKDATVEKILDVVLRENGYDYEMVDKVVVVTRAKANPVVPAVKVLKGQVKDASGKPLPGVTVILKGMSIGTATNIDGKYEIKVPEKEEVVIVFSFVGMKSQEMKFSGQKVLNVVLQEDVEQVEEVIVMGYSTRKVSEMTGAVQQFQGKTIAQSATGGSLMNALKGHTTGLQITGSSGVPGSDGDLLLRGIGTLYSSSSLSTTASAPLIVIDGVITDYTSINGVVSPSDVADITVLKDAASTAIYGSRAATGVIVVTTKKGAKDRMTVALDMKLGISTPNFGKLEYMNSQELLDYGKMALRNWWNTNEGLHAGYSNPETFIEDKLGVLYDNFDVTKTTNWRDLVYRNGLSKDVAMNIRGGGDRLQYYFSYNYYDEEGTQIGYDLTRHLFKLRLDFDVMKYLSFGVNLSGTFEKSITGNSDEDSMEDYHPWLTPYNEDGTLKYNIKSWKNYTMDPTPLRNPLQDNKYNDVTNLKNNLFGSFSATLKPFKWISFSSTNTLTLTNVNRNDYLDSRTYGGNHSRNEMSNGVLQVDDERSWTFLTSNILRLQHSFGDHNLNGIVGQEWYERHTRSSHVEMYDQIIAGERNVGGFSKQGDKTNPGVIPTGAERESASFSVFSEVNYNYAGKYMASASFRTDGSTNFGKDNRYGTFYSFSGSWLISRENFMARQDVVSNLKLRMSYGTSGKEAGMDYLNYTLYSTSNTTFDYYRNHPAYQSAYGATINQLGNDQLSWETAYNLNVGVDVALLDNRISLSADWYKRRNSDLIMSTTLPAAKGVGRQYQNVGEMENRGVELVLNTHTMKGKDFNWFTTFTFSYNDNELTKLDQEKLTRSYYKTFYEGDNIDELKKVKVTGVDLETGFAQYARVEEDGSTNIVGSLSEAVLGNGELSYVNIGLSRAPYWGGFTNTFIYKNWELYLHTTYSLNYKVYNSVLAEYTSGTSWTSSNLHKVPSGLKIWEKPGGKADIPMVNADPAFVQELNRETSFCYTDASHLRISNIRLTYNLPQQWMKKICVQSAALSFSCDNVYTFASKYFAGMDPENVGGWAAPRRFIFGLNVTF